MFIAYEVSIQLVTSLREVVPVVERFDRDLAAQMRRAASSVVLNLAEGSRSAKGNKQRHFAIAHGSAGEVKAALELAKAWGWIDDARAPREILIACSLSSGASRIRADARLLFAPLGARTRFVPTSVRE